MLRAAIKFLTKPDFEGLPERRVLGTQHGQPQVKNGAWLEPKRDDPISRPLSLEERQQC
jgi:hypothetical protein